jgi:hypothetical protein
MVDTAYDKMTAFHYNLCRNWVLEITGRPQSGEHSRSVAASVRETML